MFWFNLTHNRTCKTLWAYTLWLSLVLIGQYLQMLECKKRQIWQIFKFKEVEVGVVLGFNATLTAKVIPWRSVTHMRFLAFLNQYLPNFSFKSHRLLFPHASAEVRGENTPERKVASRTHNHQVISQTRSPLSHPARLKFKERQLGQF